MADSRSAASCSGLSAGELDSSMTFWLRRCTEQSRKELARDLDDRGPIRVELYVPQSGPRRDLGLRLDFSRVSARRRAVHQRARRLLDLRPLLRQFALDG